MKYRDTKGSQGRWTTDLLFAGGTKLEIGAAHYKKVTWDPETGIARYAHTVPLGAKFTSLANALRETALVAVEASL
jgi:hypothetical protein